MTGHESPKRVHVPFASDEAIGELRAGDALLLSGVLYTARDAAHRRMVEAMDRGEALPLPLKHQVIYYVGPTPAPPGRPIGSAGPTTAYRMDPYTPQLVELGLGGAIGKGYRGPVVKEAMRGRAFVYMAASGGAGALLSQCIREAAVIAYEDLGTEAIRRLTVEDFPVIVINDTLGTDYYEVAQAPWRRMECSQ